MTDVSESSKFYATEFLFSSEFLTLLPVLNNPASPVKPFQPEAACIALLSGHTVRQCVFSKQPFLGKSLATNRGNTKWLLRLFKAAGRLMALPAL